MSEAPKSESPSDPEISSLLERVAELEARVRDAERVAQRRAQQALRASEERFRRAFEDAPLGIAITDLVGRVEQANPSCLRMTGRESLTGVSLRELALPEEVARWDALVTGLLAGASSGQLEQRWRARDGGVVPVSITLSLLQDASQPDCGGPPLLAMLQDIAERKRLDEERRRYAETLELEVGRRTQQLAAAYQQLRELQARLLQVERVAAAEDMAASVAHAINNPLAALIGTLQMALETQPGEPVVRRALQLARRISNVVARALQLFREGSLDLESTDVRAILDDLCAELEPRCGAQGVQLEMKASAGGPHIRADRTLLGAALACIAENALEAMPGGGALALEAEALPGIGIAVFRVTDTGPGIPDALRQRVFEPFFTTKPGGSGLGLAIARGVVHGHAGRIRIDERPAGGARITVELPLEGALGSS